MVCATAVFATDLTVFVVSDTHFIKDAVDCNLCRAGVKAMNSLPGTPYPMKFGNATVAIPSAVLVCGDLCDGGSKKTGYAADLPEPDISVNYQDEWNWFDYCFPLNGAPDDYNRLKYPTYATAGNHDWWRYAGCRQGTSDYVVDQLKSRYSPMCEVMDGNVCYSSDLDGIHFVSLGRYPDKYVRKWLSSDLERVGKDMPIVLFQHYDFKTKSGEKWWKDSDRKSLADIINGYKIIAILHGHSHAACHYKWNGYDIYDDGTLGKKGDIGIMHITDLYVDYAQYRVTSDAAGNLRGGKWKWSYRKLR
ncbi:metallophosphoesterase [bacterium]|nr:metallophosphoesterase [bacterium]